MKNEENQMDIELSEEIAVGIYSNLASITHSPAEVDSDFVQIMPGMPKAKVRSRVIMSPQSAKRLLQALRDNIQKFEAQNGIIVDDNNPPFPPMNFGGTSGMA
jgi:hypothetical protein